MEAIQTCYICKEWYDEKVLSKINVPDQTGYVREPICAGCLKEIEERSQGRK